MNLKNKLKSYDFWISLSAGLVLLIDIIFSIIGKPFDKTITIGLLSVLIALLIIFGVFNNPNGGDSLTEIIEEVKDDIQNNTDNKEE